MITAIGCALLAALAYGTGAAIQQHQAAAAPSSAAGKPRLLGLLVRQPLWLFGLAAQFAGFAMHAVALRSGPLAIVQMVTAAELIVSVALVRVRSGRPLPPNVWKAGAAVLAGIVVFLALTSVGVHSRPAVAGDAGTALGAAVAGGAAIVVFVFAFRSRRALLLAVAAGLADTALAVVTSALPRHDIFGSWPVYALVTGGLCSLLLTQTAYQAARPMITLPVIAAVIPIASVAVGVAFLGDAARLGPVRAIAAGVVTLATGAAIVALARSAPAARHGRRAPTAGPLSVPISRTDSRFTPAPPAQPTR